MKAPALLFLLLAILGLSPKVSAQYIAVDENYTAEQLVKDILINNPCANVSNVSVSGLVQNGSSSFGHFTDGGSSFPFSEGVVLSTGLAASAVGPNTSLLSEGPSSWGGDNDLQAALGVTNSINATVLEFDFQPLASKVSFDYMFSSEQYLSNPSSNQCNYTDGFVFLLREASSSNYVNLAVIPGTSIPVKVNTVRGPGTVCPAANEAYFGGFNGLEHPTNFNGQTVVLTAAANVVPGTLYHMKLVVADQGNNLYDSAIFLGAGSFKIEKDLGPDRLLATNNALCAGEILTLDATEPGTNTYQWYKDGSAMAGQTNPQFPVSSQGDYQVEITYGTTICTSVGKIRVEFSPALTPSDTTLLACDPDQDGIGIFNLLGAESNVKAGDAAITSVTYYAHISDTAPIAQPTAYSSAVPAAVYAKVENAAGCFSFAQITLGISHNNPPAPPPFGRCDEDTDGQTEFDLNLISASVLQGLPPGLTVQYYETPDDAVAQTNPLPQAYTNTTPFTQTLYALIENGPDCYGLVPVTLVVHVLNLPDFQDETVFLCENSLVTLTVASGYTYLWNDGNASTTRAINVRQAGSYTVTVTDANSCAKSKTFTVVLSGIASIDDVVIDDFRGDDNSVRVTASGSGQYDYSINGGSWQTDPLFTHVRRGDQTVYVRDLNGCGTATSAIFVRDYQKFFTPNGDGYNDTWKIPPDPLYPAAATAIFDRYGKFITSLNSNNEGWDGKLNGAPLPSDDYWFVISLETGRIVRGHFALKR